MTASEQRIRALTTIGRKLTAASSVEEILAIATEAVQSVLASPGAAIYLADESGYARRMNFGWSESADKQHLGSEELALMFDGDSDPEKLAVPLMGDSKMHGVLVVERCTDPALGDSYRWLLTALADQLTKAFEFIHEQRLVHHLRSRLKKTEERATATAGAMTELSHDVRSPLNGIRMQVELLESGVLGDLNERQREALERIRGGIDDIAELATNMVESSKIMSGEIDMTLGEISLEEILDSSLQSLQALIDARGHRVSVTGAREARVVGDHDLVKRILVNLIDNAIKYTPAGGCVDIVCEQERQAPLVSITVSDTGTGVPPEATESIFAPFVRAATNSSGRAGTGLGLPIARKLAQSMGGNVVLQDPEGSPGARFSLLLPAGKG